jgi:hypothetical protein
MRRWTVLANQKMGKFACESEFFQAAPPYAPRHIPAVTLLLTGPAPGRWAAMPGPTATALSFIGGVVERHIVQPELLARRPTGRWPTSSSITWAVSIARFC